MSQMVKNLPVMLETWIQSWVRKIPWRREQLLSPVAGVAKSRTRLGDFDFLSDVSSAWLSCMHAKLLQLYLTLLDPIDCSLPGFSVHGILQARILEWFAMPSSRGSSWPKDQTCISCYSYIAGEFFTTEPPGKALTLGSCKQFTWTLKNF